MTKPAHATTLKASLFVFFFSFLSLLLRLQSGKFLIQLSLLFSLNVLHKPSKNKKKYCEAGECPKLSQAKKKMQAVQSQLAQQSNDVSSACYHICQRHQVQHSENTFCIKLYIITSTKTGHHFFTCRKGSTTLKTCQR